MKSNYCYSATSSAPASFCQETAAMLWCDRDAPWVLWWHLRTFVGSPDSWHHCPSSSMLSSRTKPGWSGQGLQMEILAKARKKNRKWSLLHQKHFGFLFRTRQLSRHSQLLLRCVCDRRTAGDVLFAPLLEEKDDQVLPDEPWAMNVGANILEESSGKAFYPLLPEETVENCWKQLASVNLGG